MIDAPFGACEPLLKFIAIFAEIMGKSESFCVGSAIKAFRSQCGEFGYRMQMLIQSLPVTAINTIC